MHYFLSLSEQNALPEAAFPERVHLGIERWREAAEREDNPDLIHSIDAIIDDEKGRNLLSAVFGNSPYLTSCAVNNPVFTCLLLQEGPDSAFEAAMEELKQGCLDLAGKDEAGLSRLLRKVKRNISFAIALADITDNWPLEKITGNLSLFAEAAISAAAGHLLLSMAERGAFQIEDHTNPEKGSGLVILGMGKLGSGELNYSSDIDLIVLYDPERVKTDTPDKLQSHFVRLTRNLVRILDERTVDGYVFRTDLRLRPDPGATPLAISVLAAETYYESIGQNWERAAMIKARPVGGDREAGEAFLKWLTPFVWRKNLDFAAIQDIHSIKRQIDAHRGGEGISALGHNVKLGRGGIREIEFFAQTQQLIWGGKMVELRQRPTRLALDALTDTAKVESGVRDDLLAAYRFLRRVEHRLQMIDDEQTHSLPDDPCSLKHVAMFLGYRDTETFSEELTQFLKSVEAHYANLFDDAPSLGSANGDYGNLVFTGGDADPDTIDTIRRVGYANPEAVDAMVRGWHHGRYRATRSARSREILTELFPLILKSLSETPDPDAAFLKFDEFLSGLPSGVQLFSMFHSNPGLLDLVAEIMGGAPRLAEHLSRRPHVLESVLTSDFFDPPPSVDVYNKDLKRILEQAMHRDNANLEDVLVACRRWANDRRFQIGVQSLRGHLSPRETARALSDIADAAITRLCHHVEMDYAKRHGGFGGDHIEAGPGMVIIAMGKLGSREMTPESDLDLVYIYDLPEGADASDGDKPLSPGQYYARLGQRFINALTVQTSEGDLYEVDMRLRPSGTAGPIATGLASFEHYHQNEAWTWEHMALTRARVISGPPDLCTRVTDIIHSTLTCQRDPEHLLSDVADMRLRMEREHRTEFIWDVKHIRGGLIDLEFITQYLQLRHAREHPDILSVDTVQVLQQLMVKKIIAENVARELTDSLNLWQGLQGMLRLTIPRKLRSQRDHSIPEALQERLIKIAGVDTFETLIEKMQETRHLVLRHYDNIIAKPAADIEESRT